MAVKHAVLGLLLQKETYPYELSLLFKERIGPAWDVNRGHVYQIVHQLAREGLAERVDDKSKGDRTVYRATEKGALEFNHWFERRGEKVRPHRDDLIVKLALSRPEHADYLLKAIDRQEQKCSECLYEYSEVEAYLKSLKSTNRWCDTWPMLILKAAIYHLQADIKWLGEVRDDLLDRIDGDSSAIGVLSPNRANRG